MNFKHLYRNGHPVATVAWQQEGNTVTMAMARCNPGDNYSKKIGRQIVCGRIQNVDAVAFDNAKHAAQYLIRECNPIVTDAVTAEKTLNAIRVAVQHNNEKDYANS